MHVRIAGSGREASHGCWIVSSGRGKKSEQVGKVAWEGEARTAGDRRSADLKKSDSIRTTAESGERRAWSSRCETSSLATSLCAAAAAFQFLRVFSAISAPFGLNALDSCSHDASKRGCGAVGLARVNQQSQWERVPEAAAAAGLVSLPPPAERTARLAATTSRHQHALTSTRRRATKQQQA